MSLKNYNRFIESIRDELTPYQRRVVTSKWGNEYLNAETPDKNKKIPEGTWEISDEDAITVLNNYFKLDLSFVKEYIGSLDDNFIKVLKKSIINKNIKDKFDLNTLNLITIKSIFSNTFRLLNPKETEQDRKILRGSNDKPILDDDNKPQYVIKEKGEPVFTKNISNINTFIDSYNKSYPDNKIENKFTKDDFATLASFYQEGVKNFSIINNDKMYLTITSNPSDTLNMSASPFFTSCQDIYRDTGYEKDAISNVFDINTKVAFIFYKKPYYVNDKKVSDKTFICRTLVRDIKKEDKFYVDQAYPHRMQEILESLLYKYSGIVAIDYDESDDVKYDYEPDINYYSDRKYTPYLDTLNSSDVNKKVVIGKNTHTINLTGRLVMEINGGECRILDDNNVTKVNIDVYDFLNDNKSLKPIENILNKFKKLNTIQFSDYTFDYEISVSDMTYNKRLCLNKFEFKDNLFWDDLLSNNNINMFELISCDDKVNNNKMPDISKLKNLVEVGMLYTYRYLSPSLLELPKLKYLTISRNIIKYNKDMLNELKKKGVKITEIGL